MNHRKALIALALGTFALGVAEFGMMGVLGDVARGVDVSIVKAGHLISIYSAGVACGSPALVLLHRMPLRRLMILLAAMILLGNLLAAISVDFTMLLCSRFLSGLPHGAYFGAGAIVCSRLAAKGHGAAAVAVMIGGMTVANLAGVPLATLAANLAGWRYPFAIVAFMAALALACLYRWLPSIEPLPDTGIKGQFAFLRSSAPWLIYGGVFFGQASVYCWLSYIEPIMTRVTGFSGAAMTYVMVIVGLGMVVGNAVAGRLADRHSVSVVCGLLAAAMAIVMPAIYLLDAFKIPSLLLAFMASFGLFGIGGPLQYLIVRFAKGGEMLGGAGIQIAFNVSNAVSAWIGGVTIGAGWGLSSPALVGVPFALAGATFLWLLHRRYGHEGA
ncbi:MFS transporter [Paramuribaculum intestinale]|uniref:MFS transporter n=1 Tax=Paramuribaculum intestinale TaxID=2094151 RepID=UPI0025A9FC74|nr:MFS transporter [Paramuribaculum intestinale]